MLHSGYRSASFQRPSRRSNTEMYSSGRRGRTRNSIGRVTGARVQLPSSPLLKKTCPVIRAGLFHVLTNAFSYSSLIFFLTYSCFRLLFFDILFNAYFSHAANFICFVRRSHTFSVMPVFLITKKGRVKKRKVFSHALFILGKAWPFQLKLSIIPLTP